MTTTIIAAPPGTAMTLAEYRALGECEGVWELVDGVLHEMEPPTYDHQNLVDFLVAMLNLYLGGLASPLGWAVSGIGVALSERRAPTPDIVYLRAARMHLIRGSFVEGIPDLVAEVLSQDRAKDLTRNRQWYAEAGIPEYWILDPAQDTLTILELTGDRYTQRAVLTADDTLTTPAIPGFALPLARLFRNPGRTMPASRR